MKLNQNSTNSNRHTSSRSSIWDKINTGEIGQGKFFTEGRYGNRRNLGLKGQLSRLKRMGRFGATQNLSKQNIDSIYKIISDRLKKHQTSGVAHINRLDKRAIMQEAEKLVRSDSKFTRYDKADVKSIIDAISEKTKEQSLARERYENTNEQKNADSTVEIKIPTIKNTLETSYSGGARLEFIEKETNPMDQNNVDNKDNLNKIDNIDKDDDIELPDTKHIKDMPI